MAYKVLYRKYRPDNFEKIVGQKIITETLKNSIIESNFSHAYIFTGPRGTGKTSTAKVLAKAINCESPNNGEPCGHCKNCVDFATSPDIIEIDAASNNGVDEIRELRSNVTLAPSAGKYKVYIIDEVHMLSSGAFNALLKTLEEPPAHAIFILATTEIYKVPITILSRCQRFDFKKLDEKTMLEHLKSICKQENIAYDDDALKEIYDLSDGCLRDALSLLDQTSKTVKKITLDVILDSYNIISNKTVDTLITNVHNGDVNSTIEIINKFESSGMNAQKLLKKMINYLEKIAINIKLSKEKRFQFKEIKNFIEKLNDLYTEARVNDNIFSIIKIVFLDEIPSESTADADKQDKKGNNLLKADSKIVVVAGNSIDIRINNCFVEANKEALSQTTDIWTSLDKNKLADIDLSEYKPVVASAKYAIFSVDDESLADLFNIKSETIEKLLKKNKLPIKVVAISQKRWEKEKQIYKNNRINKMKYEYIDEPYKADNNEKIAGEVDDIFTDKFVEIS